MADHRTHERVCTNAAASMARRERSYTARLVRKFVNPNGETTILGRIEYKIDQSRPLKAHGLDNLCRLPDQRPVIVCRGLYGLLLIELCSNCKTNSISHKILKTVLL